MKNGYFMKMSRDKITCGPDQKAKSTPRTNRSKKEDNALWFGLSAALSALTIHYQVKLLIIQASNNDLLNWAMLRVKTAQNIYKGNTSWFSLMRMHWPTEQIDSTIGCVLKSVVSCSGRFLTNCGTNWLSSICNYGARTFGAALFFFWNCDKLRWRLV